MYLTSLGRWFESGSKEVFNCLSISFTPSFVYIDLLFPKRCKNIPTFNTNEEVVNAVFVKIVKKKMKIHLFTSLNYLKNKLEGGQEVMSAL